MALPINIEELLSGRVIETERLEFKEGWNPPAVLHTMCAFANDINNWGGGYIVIGIGEKSGGGDFLVKGLSAAEIAKIQKEIIGLSYKIQPEYVPIVEVTKYNGKNIVIIWVPGGVRRPYKAALNLSKGAQYAYYLRRNDTTKRAAVTDERELMKLVNDIPFDDRVNYKAAIDDLNIQLIRQYLYTVKSALLNEMSKLSLKDLCRRMNIVGGPEEDLRPKNIGLMLFCDEPQKYFPVAQIDVVKYKDKVGDDFYEKIFKGPIHEQLRAALQYIKDSIIVEYVHKVEGRAEADRFFNYPYGAIEEAVVNAVYHRSYEEREPVVVRIYPEQILIISYPGPVPPLGKDNINKPIIKPPRYRNRRLGDFLKELEFTEGRCTGFPKIRQTLKANGSPAPVFETDKAREYFMVTLKINPKAKEMAVRITLQKALVGEGLNEGLNEGLKSLLEVIRVTSGIKAKDLSPRLNGRPIKTIERQIKVLTEKNFIERRGSRKTGGYYIK